MPARREFLQLAHDYSSKYPISGFFVSEKLEGHRGMWDGGVTRGMDIEDVPWANLAKSGHGRKATGLWSRYGHPIHAPAWWLDKLPRGLILDGELWSGRGQMQFITSVVKTTVNLDNVVADWVKMKFMCFDAISPRALFTPGMVNNPNYSMLFTENMYSWYMRHYLSLENRMSPYAASPFASTYAYLSKLGISNDVLNIHTQVQLPYQPAVAKSVLDGMIDKCKTIKDCEGLIVRSPDECWKPLRLHTMLKVKERDDDIAKVVGYRSGRVGLEGNLHGKMGSLYVEWRGLRFKLSGFDFPERELTHVNDAILSDEQRNWALSNPDQDCPSWFNMKNFPLGSEVKFAYRGVTEDGVPKEAAYKR